MKASGDKGGAGLSPIYYFIYKQAFVNCCCKAHDAEGQTYVSVTLSNALSAQREMESHLQNRSCQITALQSNKLISSDL